MPLTPEEDALCGRLEELDAAVGPAAAAVIRRQANEIDALWDRLNRAYMVARGEVGKDLGLAEEIKQLQRLAEKRATTRSAR